MKKIFKALLITILGTTISLNLVGQDRNIKKLSKHKRQKIAHDLVKSGSYYNAIDQLNELVKTYPQEKEFVYQLGHSYYVSRDYVNAELWLKKAIDLDSTNIGLPHFYYADALKYNAKYVEAKAAFAKFNNSNYKDDKITTFKNIARNEIESCAFAEKEKSYLAYSDIVNIGANINSGYTDFSPTLKGDTLYFASLQEDSVIYHDYEATRFKHVKIYTAQNQGGAWSMPSELDAVNDKLQNTANGVFNKDFTKFYYTQCSADKRTAKMHCKIYESVVQNGVILKGAELKGLVNAESMTFTQPFPFTIGSGKSATEALYFVSDMPGGKGGLDIWYTTYDLKRKEWKKATNVGGAINTVGDEITPFYDFDNEALYFSSNYHYGFGGYDIFKAYGRQTKWQKPENLGMPINSRVDDTYFTIKGAEEKGFLVSNRPGGTHLLSETCCDDIYTHQYQNTSLVAVRIFNKKQKTQMEGVDIGLLTSKGLSAESLTKAEITNFQGLLFDSVPSTGANRNPVKFSTTDVQYFYKVAPENNYMLSVKVPNSDSVKVFINSNAEGKLSLLKPVNDTIAKTDIKHSNKVDVLFVDLYLNPTSATKNVVQKPKTKLADVSEFTIAKVFKDNKLKDKTAAIDLKVILNFDLGDIEFLAGKEEALDSLKMLLTEYPDLNIEIAAHTDNMGEHDFNMDLSKKRAATIEDFLIKKGVSKIRMKSKGYGETQPLTPNDNPDGTDNPEARAQNRRAEIRITRNFSKGGGTKTGSSNSKTKKK